MKDYYQKGFKDGQKTGAFKMTLILFVLLAIGCFSSCAPKRGYIAKKKSYAYVITPDNDTIGLTNREVKIYKLTEKQ